MSSTKGKVIKCKAAVAWEKCKPMTIEEIEVSPPKAGEVRIKIVSTGMCHSDLSGWKGIIIGINFPSILGHEAAGIVESVGEGITTVKEGDHVLTSFLPECQKCPACKSTDSNFCTKYQQRTTGLMEEGTSRISCKGKQLFNFLGCSTFAEYAVLNEGSVVKVDKEASLEKICLLSCGVTTGYGGPVKTAKVKPGSTCAVFGLGTVGLAAVMGCKVRGATRIIGVDINNGKKDIAKKFGVTEFYNPTEYDKPIHEVLMEKTQGGCDYTFECIGNHGVIESALSCCKIGTGQSVIIGVPPFGKKMEVDPYQILFGRVWTGCFLGGYKPHEVSGLIEDYKNKKIMLDEFITSTLTLKDVNEAFDLLIQGKTIKTVLTV